MDILIGKRQQGKTTHLIKMSAAGEGIIVAPTEHGAAYIKTLAKEMGLDIPEPVNWSRFTQNGWARGHKGPYLIDELGEILRGVNIKTAILDDECNIEYLSGGPLHYGDELTAKSRKTQKISANFQILTSLSLITGTGMKRGKHCKRGTNGTGKRLMIF